MTRNVRVDDAVGLREVEAREIEPCRIRVPSGVIIDSDVGAERELSAAQIRARAQEAEPCNERQS